MAWVRIHDGAMSHPKILSLTASAFRLWVGGLSYCQQHLTDGLIPVAALSVLLGTKADANQLITAGLWRTSDTGYIVHDYLEWNDSREVVQKKRASLKARVTRYRRVTDSVTERVTERVSNASTTSGVVNSTNDQIKKDDQTFSVLEGVQGKPSPPKASGRQMGRIFLHRWQLDELIATLGAHAAGFALDEWLDDLSRRPDVLPADRWSWVKAELQAEVRRRGLPVAATQAAPTNKRIAGLVRGGEAFLRSVAAEEGR